MNTNNLYLRITIFSAFLFIGACSEIEDNVSQEIAIRELAISEDSNEIIENERERIPLLEVETQMNENEIQESSINENRITEVYHTNVNREPLQENIRRIDQRFVESERELEIPFGPAEQPWLSEERRQAYRDATPTRLREQEQERAIMEELMELQREGDPRAVLEFIERGQSTTLHRSEER